MNLNDALPHVLDVEGGWVNDPQDPGGATMRGVTFRTFKRAVDQRIVDGPKTTERLRTLTEAEAGAIYREMYWRPAGCDIWPCGVRYLVFDAAVNQGVSRSVRFLQRAAGATQDGIPGPKTAEAVRAMPKKRLVRDFCVYRAMHYTSLAHFARFGKGWLRRLFDAHRIALRELL